MRRISRFEPGTSRAIGLALAGLSILLGTNAVLGQAYDLADLGDDLFHELFLQGPPADEHKLVEAHQIWTALANEGDVDAQYYLAFLFFEGLGGASLDEEKAMSLISSAANAGHADAQYKLAHAYEFGQIYPQDYDKAVEWYRKSAAQGNWLASRRLERAYSSGELGLPRDPEAATRWQQQAISPP